MRCDVLVVGGGPAGSSAASAAAAMGLKTVLVEKKEDIVGTAFSGAIGSYLAPFLPFEMPLEFIKQRIDGLEFHVKDLVIRRRGGPWKSYCIDRTSFDKWLLRRAEEAGAQVYMGTELLDIDYESGKGATRAKLRGSDQSNFEVEFRVVVGADGVHSTVLDSLGMKNDQVRRGKAVVIEFEGVQLESQKIDQIYYGDFVPGGYAHLFPSGEGQANIGVGSILDVDIDDCLEQFLAFPPIERQLKNAVTVSRRSGWVSFDLLSGGRQYDNVLLAGEAASQNLKPLVEGFLPSIICGDIAGKTAGKYLQRNEPLAGYQRNLNRILGPLFQESDKLLKTLEKLSDLAGEKGSLLLAAVSSNLLSAGEAEQLINKREDEIKDIIQSRSSSRIRQAYLKLSESALLSLLKAYSRLNRKIYKL